MKIYKDKDPYVYNDSLYAKQRKREARIKRIISALMACEIFCTVMVGLFGVKSDKYAFDKENPFDGQSISSSDFSANYKAMKAKSFVEDECFKETINNIKNSNVEEKKAYLLYYALLSNEYLTTEEKKVLAGYIQYFIDNKYLDYEYVYNKLSSFKINPNDESLYENGNAGIYTRADNSITFANDSERDYAISHEIFHAEDKSGELLSYSDYAWFIEGLVCVLNYEYLNDKDNAKNIKAYFIRLLCELVDPDILLQVRSTGNMNILINALKDKGVHKEDTLELFKLFNDYNFLKKEERTINGAVNDINEKLKIQISIKLIEIYNTVYNTPDTIKPIYREYMWQIQSDGIPVIGLEREDIYYYYFNSQKKGPFEKFENDCIIIYHQDRKEIIFSSLESINGKTVKKNETTIDKINQSDFNELYENLLNKYTEKENAKTK